VLPGYHRRRHLPPVPDPNPNPNNHNRNPKSNPTTVNPNPNDGAMGQMSTMVIYEGWQMSGEGGE